MILHFLISLQQKKYILVSLVRSVLSLPPDMKIFHFKLYGVSCNENSFTNEN